MDGDTAGAGKSKTKVPRRSAPKVRTGCVTCKYVRLQASLLHVLTTFRIRHVKCDETKPSCLRCSSTGRTCDGYDSEKTGGKPDCRSKSSLTRSPTATQEKWLKDEISTQPVTDVRAALIKRTVPLANGLPQHSLQFNLRGTPAEHRALNFFFYNTAPSLSGAFDGNFWTKLLPRLAATEPSIHHATVAIAALHEKQLTGSDSHADDEYLSLVQYNKAIRVVHKQISSGSASHIVTLSTCLLFICLEFMRHAPDKALAHFQSGLSIIKGAQRTVDSSFIASDASKSPLDEEVLSAFFRLSIQAHLMGRPPAEPIMEYNGPSEAENSCTPFVSLREARDDLMLILSQSLEQDNEVEMDLSLIPPWQPKYKRELMVSQLQQWTSRLGLSMTGSLRDPTQAELAAIRLLRIQSIVAIIWNSALTKRGTESAFDEHAGRFKTVIPLALAIVEFQESSGSGGTSKSKNSACQPQGGNKVISGSSRQAGLPGSFGVEMGIIFALYFIATKCRCPVTRRAALNLLPRVRPQREAGWDASRLHYMSQYVIDYEESDSTVTQDMATWPKDSQRIIDIQSEDVYDHQSKTSKITFTCRPNGRDGEVVRWTEMIPY